MVKFFKFFKPISSGPYWCGVFMMVFGVGQITWQLLVKPEPLAVVMVMATKDLGLPFMAVAGAAGSMIPSMGIMGSLMLMMGLAFVVHGILVHMAHQDRMREGFGR